MTSQPPAPYQPEPPPPGQQPPPPGQYQPPPGQYQPQPGQYQQYPYYPPAPRGTNTMAILALVLAFVFAPAAIILGHLARKQIRQTGEDGDGLALAGLIIGYILTGITVAFCVGYVIFAVILFGAVAATAPPA